MLLSQTHASTHLRFLPLLLILQLMWLANASQASFPSAAPNNPSALTTDSARTTNHPALTIGSDLTNSSPLLNNSAAAASSAQPSFSDSLSQSLSNTSFLPVEKAYQLSAQLVTDPLAPAPTPLLSLHWDIAPGYYLYQHQLKLQLNDEDLPLTLPAGIRKYDDYFEQELQVYYHSLTLLVPLPADADNTTLTLHSQGCADAGLCYPPQQQQLRIHNGTVELLAAFGPHANPVSTHPSSADQTLGLGFWLALVSAFAGGILLNLMPCVFPVLSLKALSLAGNGGNTQQQRRHGWAYTLGVIATFVGIAAVMLFLRHAGQAIGWGFQLQSPLVVALLAYLFFVMGLTLSGFIQLGGQLSGSGQALTEGNSYRASFFTGALATVVASPCTAPFMGGALGFAVTQPAPLALLVFAALGLGMAAPFLLLAYFPTLSRRLPKPGQWMDTLKQLLAFPLYLTALWLLWVVGRQTGSDAVVARAAGALGLAFAAWLWQHRPARLIQKVLALILLAAALLPLSDLNSGRPSQIRDNSATALDHQWQPYTPARLAQLLDSGTPTFVNLTADWCITCLANEKIALDRDNTQQAFTQAGIVKLKGDWTHYNPEITQLLAQFDRNGVPLYLLYSGKRNEPPVILPQILREQTVIDAIEALNLTR